MLRTDHDRGQGDVPRGWWVRCSAHATPGGEGGHNFRLKPPSSRPDKHASGQFTAPKMTYVDEPSSLPYSQPFCASGINTVMTSPGSNRSRVRLTPVAWGTIACTLAAPLLLLPSLPLPDSPKDPEREVRPVGSKPAGRHPRALAGVWHPPARPTLPRRDQCFPRQVITLEEE